MKAFGLGVWSVLVVGLLAGCGAEDLSVGGGDSELSSAASEVESGAILAKLTFYAVRPDLRLCPSPICGGVWVRALNRSLTRCANGTYNPECYAAKDDWSALGLSPEELNRVRTRVLSGHGIVQGSLVASPQSPSATSVESAPTDLGELRVSSAWLAATERAAEGLYYRVRELPVDCVPSAACLPIVESKLNSGEVRRVLRVNFSLTGASREQIRKAVEAMAQGNLIVAGKNRPVFFPTESPAGALLTRPVEELLASQFFFRVPRPAVTCADVRCESGTFCYDGDGAPRCIPYNTCATTPLLCSAGQHCEDVPIACVRAPCPPTAPTCVANRCPPDGTINCMPIVPPERAPLCSGPYHEWIVRNCPGVQFTC